VGEDSARTAERDHERAGAEIYSELDGGGDVHLYVTVRVKVAGVEARVARGGHFEAALKLVEPLDQLNGNIAGHYFEYADEVTSALVDFEGDGAYEQSTVYSMERRRVAQRGARIMAPTQTLDDEADRESGGANAADSRPDDVKHAPGFTYGRDAWGARRRALSILGTPKKRTEGIMSVLSEER